MLKIPLHYEKNEEKNSKMMGIHCIFTFVNVQIHEWCMYIHIVLYTWSKGILDFTGCIFIKNNPKPVSLVHLHAVHVTDFGFLLDTCTSMPSFYRKQHEKIFITIFQNNTFQLNYCKEIK